MEPHFYCQPDLLKKQTSGREGYAPEVPDEQYFNSYIDIMNNFALSYSRYWEPSYLQATSISMIAGAVATWVTFPAQFLKTVMQYQGIGIGFRGKRFQQQGYNPFKVLRMYTQKGHGSAILYTGFDAFLYSRLSYLLVRNGLYTVLYNFFKPNKAYNDLSYREKALIAAVAGTAGAIVSHPFTLVSIRQQLDTQINPDWRRNYSNNPIEAVNQLRASGELWQGLKINILRHLIFNVSLTGPYDYFKEGFYTRFGEYGFVDPLALLCATFITAAVSLPVDNIRTRICQLHKQTERNKVNFSTLIGGLGASVRTEKHWLALWAGFTTFYPQLFFYAYLTVGITNSFTESWKKKEGLLEWQL